MTPSGYTVSGYTPKSSEILVANQIQRIHVQSDASQWSYVPSKLNPADDVSYD